MEIVILPSARRHNIADADIVAVFHAPIRTTHDANDDDVVIVVGFDRQGALVEIGFIRGENATFVIHAMPARPKYLR